MSPTLFGKVLSSVILGVPSGSLELQGTLIQSRGPRGTEATIDAERGLREMVLASSIVQTLKS